MALNVERIVDGGVRRQEPLRRSGRFETLHLPLASSHRQMRIFGPIVLPQALLMAEHQKPETRICARETPSRNRVRAAGDCLNGAPETDDIDASL
jgi:hypothetical protein